MIRVMEQQTGKTGTLLQLREDGMALVTFDESVGSLSGNTSLRQLWVRSERLISITVKLKDVISPEVMKILKEMP